MNILTVTTSARGHAIVDALSRSPSNPRIVSIAPSKNPGISKIAARMEIMDVMDFDGIVATAKEEDIDIAIIGPEDPICGGISDRLQAEGIGCIAPTESLARIEGSKGFTRDLLTKYDIDVSPRYKVFTAENSSDIPSYIDELDQQYVVKYDSLKGGKGVKVSGEHLDNKEDGIAYAHECIEEGGQVVIEEKLIGVEFSLISLVSGEHVVDCPAVQDHKRAFEGDTGPNTGGMGTYSDSNHSLPFLTDGDIADAKQINRAVAAALQQECNEVYQGVLYGGFIVTKNGVKLIEYNCRFGDPEALNILPLLQSDFVEICKAIVDGTLSDEHMKFRKSATVCRYITPMSYPVSKDQQGDTVTFPSESDNVRIYYGDIHEDHEGMLHLGGSRSAGVVGMGDTLEEAQQHCLAACEHVIGPVRFRADIGTQALIQKRIEIMKHLRT